MIDTSTEDGIVTQQQRLNLLLDALAQVGQLTVAEIAERFQISDATARRDLNFLADRRLVTRTHGGAVSVGAAYELPLQYKIARNAEAKQSIATLAASLVKPGDVIGLTGGTTTSEVARALGQSAHLQSNDNSTEPQLTIVTNALNIAYEMAIRPNIKIVTTGGVAKSRTFELVGPLVGHAVASMTLDWAMIGVDGLHPRFGATTVDEAEAEVNRLLAEAARNVAIVADFSKMNQSAFGRICTMADLDVIVTDQEPPAEIREEARKSNIEILIPS
ncbi:DeoR/GlpR family DNA-binding transcription regulator [Humidisolicoccus flavus]|uniref:DeoR/GlpR family DNA-binding transcription regulator n=1 Tax=Humidisolicoccus flavus TaxID=3111414 RepID=UPI00324CE71D